MSKRLIGIYGVRIFEQNVLQFIKSLKREGEKEGYQLLSFSANSDTQEETDEIVGQYQLIELFCHVDICALIILTETIKNEQIIQKLVDLGRKKKIPVFSLDRKVECCYNLLMDNEGGFEQIVRHIVEEHQCKHVNMIAGFKGNRFSEERINVYKRVLQDNGIPFEEERLGYGDFWEQPVEEVVKHFFESDLPFPEAIVCANDTMAITAISMLNQKGFEVPEDVIVTGYDGTKNGAYFFPSLTTGCPKYETMVKRVFEEIAKYSEEKRIEPCDIVIPVTLQKLQSCGCEEKMMRNNNRVVSNLLAEIKDGTWHTIAMHQLINDTLGKQHIKDVAQILPKRMNMWCNHYRYACIKSELFHSYETPENDTEMVSILDANQGKFRETGKSWSIIQFQCYVQSILEKEKVSTIIVHLLNSGKDVYGFSVEGFEEMVDWQIKRCGEFAIFLSQVLHAVIHNFKMNELNRNLYEANKEIEELSLLDSMTGIYNRRGFFRKMKQILLQKQNLGKYLYLFFIDMDGLKHINDNYGHAEGDFAIITLAKVLAKMGKEDMVCARVGGDEFICSFVNESGQYFTSDEFSRQMESYLMETESVMDKPYQVSISVGMVCEEISENLDLNLLINHADDKMYENKLARKNKH